MAAEPAPTVKELCESFKRLRREAEELLARVREDGSPLESLERPRLTLIRGGRDDA